MIKSAFDFYFSIWCHDIFYVYSHELYFDFLYQVCCPDLASCIFVLEQAVSVRALQEMVSATSTEQVDSLFLLHRFNLGIILYCSRRRAKGDKQHFEHYYTDMLFFFDIIKVKWWEETVYSRHNMHIWLNVLWNLVLELSFNKYFKWQARVWCRLKRRCTRFVKINTAQISSFSNVYYVTCRRILLVDYSSSIKTKKWRWKSALQWRCHPGFSLLGTISCMTTYFEMQSILIGF